jgi:hypothetical protein
MPRGSPWLYWAAEGRMPLSVFTQDPMTRPTARYLLQHRFVLTALQQHYMQQAETGSECPPALLPLVAQSMAYLEAMAPEPDAPPPQMPGAQQTVGAATGHFSWKGAAAVGGTSK